MQDAAVVGVRWVPQGRSHARPARALPKDELERLKEEAEGAAKAMRRTKKVPSSAAGGEEADEDADVAEEFNLDGYDDDNEEGDMDFKGNQFFGMNALDYKAAADDADVRPDGKDIYEEEDALVVRASDMLMVTVSAKADGDSLLELFVYDQPNESFYVHHDYLLNTIPLCVEWMESCGSKVASRNICAIGSFDPHIEIWNLDSASDLAPAIMLGDPHAASFKKKKGKKTKSTTGHSSSVLCLSAHPQGKLLASGSADTTVKVWDVEGATVIHTYKHHTDKVQAVKWHPVEEGVFLSAGFDKKVALLDARTPDKVLRASLSDEAESAVWDRHSPTMAYVSLSNGKVAAFDIRQMAQGSAVPLWTLDAHTAACTGVTDGGLPGMLVTCSETGYARVWNSTDTRGALPSLVCERKLGAGPLFNVTPNPDNPHLFGFGGNCPVVWDMCDRKAIAETWGFEYEGNGLEWEENNGIATRGEESSSDEDSGDEEPESYEDMTDGDEGMAE